MRGVPFYGNVHVNVFKGVGRGVGCQGLGQGHEGSNLCLRVKASCQSSQLSTALTHSE